MAARRARVFGRPVQLTGGTRADDYGRAPWSARSGLCAFARGRANSATRRREYRLGFDHREMHEIASARGTRVREWRAYYGYLDFFFALLLLCVRETARGWVSLIAFNSVLAGGRIWRVANVRVVWHVDIVGNSVLIKLIRFSLGGMWENIWSILGSIKWL